MWHGVVWLEQHLQHCSMEKCSSAHIVFHPFCTQNDSGGPIVRYDVDGVPVQTGLVSWGNGCAQPGFPGVYAQIAGPGFTWIHSVLKKDKEEKDKEKDKEKDMPGKRRNIRI